MIMRGLCIVVGIAMLAGSAHINTLAAGGYDSHHGLIMPLVAAGVAVGSLYVGSVRTQRRWALAGCLVIAICVAEAWSFFSTAERLVAAREASQASAKRDAEVRSQALDRLRRAETGLSAVPSSSPGLEAALRARGVANEAATQNSAKNGCRENCRQLLQAQVDAAEADVRQARGALDAQRNRAQGELEAAQTAMRALPAPQAVNPLAERIGLPAWLLDLLNSALGSIALNGLACCLLAAGAHAAPAARAFGEVDIAPAVVAEAPRLSLTATNTPGLPARFASECLRPEPEGTIALEVIETAYRKWCEAKGLEPVGRAELAKRLASLFERASVVVAPVGDKVSAQGVTLVYEASAE